VDVSNITDTRKRLEKSAVTKWSRYQCTVHHGVGEWHLLCPLKSEPIEDNSATAPLSRLLQVGILYIAETDSNEKAASPTPLAECNVLRLTCSGIHVVLV
jgi:hypothetical protein